MFDKIQKIISEKKLTPKDCEYHTLRNLENNGKVRVLVMKGDKTAYIELICPYCGNYTYVEQEYKHVSKASKIRLRVECSNCHKKTKVEKLKSKK
jgi:ribosomal protein S27E